MQAIKNKLNNTSALRHAKAEAKEEEKAEKELAKTRIEVAHEVRLAREAEAAMDLHVNKAAGKVAREEAKHSMDNIGNSGHGGGLNESCVHGGRTTGMPAHGGGNNARNTDSTVTNFSDESGYMGNAPTSR